MNNKNEKLMTVLDISSPHSIFTYAIVLIDVFDNETNIKLQVERYFIYDIIAMNLSIFKHW